MQERDFSEGWNLLYWFFIVVGFIGQYKFGKKLDHEGCWKFATILTYICASPLCIIPFHEMESDALASLYAWLGAPTIILIITLIPYFLLQLIAPILGLFGGIGLAIFIILISSGFFIFII